MSTLIARNLVKRYKRFTAVSHVSVSVDAGEVVGLLGPNGAGKTTSFYMIVGLVKADEGEILLNGADVTLQPMHRRAQQGIGYLPQEASVFRGLTVEENIKAILELQGERDEHQLEHLCEELLHELQIGHLKDKPAIALSGGERRRVEIARALAAEPKFMLLDEPFAGVDPISVIDIQRIIGHLRDRGIGVLITDHNVRETLGICDRAYILNGGEVIAEGDPQSILEHSDVRRVYLGDDFRM